LKAELLHALAPLAGAIEVARALAGEDQIATGGPDPDRKLISPPTAAAVASSSFAMPSLMSPAVTAASPSRPRPVISIVEGQQLLVLGALDDGERSPGHVIVDARHLSRAPDQRDDREAAVGLGVEHVAAKRLGASGPLLGSEDARRGEVALEFRGDEPSGLRQPVRLATASRTAVVSVSS
jgi:hypothetical protein